MNIRVTHCTDCPFMEHHTTSWDDDVYECRLIKFINKDKPGYTDNTLAVYDFGNYEFNDEDGFDKPDWCPLLNDKVEVEL